MNSHILFLLLGSNLGDREQQISQCLGFISEKIGRMIRLSSKYETEPWGFDSEMDFLNMAVMVETRLTPEAVLQQILEIEQMCGRKRQGTGYASRTLDIDILFYDDLVLDTDRLKVPHPRLEERRFVLVPLEEIARDWIHPVSRKTMGDLLDACSDVKAVRKAGDPANNPG